MTIVAEIFVVVCDACTFVKILRHFLRGAFPYRQCNTTGSGRLHRLEIGNFSWMSLVLIFFYGRTMFFVFMKKLIIFRARFSPLHGD